MQMACGTTSLKCLAFSCRRARGSLGALGQVLGPALPAHQLHAGAACCFCRRLVVAPGRSYHSVQPPVSGTRLQLVIGGCELCVSPATGSTGVRDVQFVRVGPSAHARHPCLRCAAAHSSNSGLGTTRLTRRHWLAAPQVSALPAPRELRYLELSAAFGEFRPDFGLPTNLSALSKLSELRLKVWHQTALRACTSVRSFGHLRCPV